ncbi:MAG: glutathione S-transferase family protein [Micropepsaceae bacterium]
MSELTVVTYDWVPEPPRGHVRDVRICWALEEAGLPYRVETTPFRDRGPDHFAHQPFGQVPWLIDGDISVFESGAILLYLGEKSGKLLPTAKKARIEAIEWLIAGLNSMEMVTVPWSIHQFSNDKQGAAWERTDGWLTSRLTNLEKIIAKRDWLAGAFSISDILMADILRLVDRFDGLENFPATRAYVTRATARPAFIKARDEQIARFKAADAAA